MNGIIAYVVGYGMVRLCYEEFMLNIAATIVSAPCIRV